MSQLPIRSPKHCAKQGLNVEKFYKKLFYIISTLVLSLLSLVFVVWLVHPLSKPHFYLKESDLYQLNLSGPHLLNSTIQITLVSKNPNRRVGIYYDRLQVYASYKGQKITLDAPLPPFHQGHEESNILSALLSGNLVPVAPSFGDEVSRDQLEGRMILNLKLNGQLRWNVGSWVSGHYHFNVDCLAAMALGPNAVSASLTSSSSKQGVQCSIDL
ncbi:NDR1/HIN1-like protein 26 [Aristolochia californica]|uniref:NDR1/HIN1-like protein 26 n=1 Tax=Aristolochia californica TaxID=171875 RepID=UPI0035DC60B9